MRHLIRINFGMPNFSEAESPAKPRGRIGLAAMTTARIVLGLGMVPYGLNKVLDYQFQVQAWKYARPLGEASGTTLTWAFLGYHPHFQILLGILELIPAFLLFFARTRRIGALLMFPVLLNVVLINFYLSLWPTTQIISSVLLAINIFLGSPTIGAALLPAWPCSYSRLPSPSPAGSCA